MQQAATCQRLCHAACQGKTASSPPKPCHPQSQRHTRSVMPLAKKQQAPRQPERRHAKQASWASTFCGRAPCIRFGPTPLLAKKQQGRTTAPAAQRQPLRGQKPSPVERAEDMPVCLFAQGPFASAEYLVQLTSSLAQKVYLGTGKPLSPRGMAQKPYRLTKHPKP